MVDHPLIADDLKSYISNHQIEITLNKGLNDVLSSLPQDPFSTMAASLIDVSPPFPFQLPCLVDRKTASV